MYIKKIGLLRNLSKLITNSLKAPPYHPILCLNQLVKLCGTLVETLKLIYCIFFFFPNCFVRELRWFLLLRIILRWICLFLILLSIRQGICGLSSCIDLGILSIASPIII